MIDTTIIFNKEQEAGVSGFLQVKKNEK